LMPLGMALVGPVTKAFGERQFLLSAIVFHLVVCGLVLLVPGVKDLRTPNSIRNSSQGEQLQG
jgi:hypothetical protein